MPDPGPSKAKSSSGETSPVPAGPEAGLLHQEFLRQAAATPQAVALLYEGKGYSYGEVEAKARAIACQLHAGGLRPGQRLAILAERRPELIWTLLGALRLGAVFMILDSAYPPGRLQTLLDVARPDAVIAAGSAVLQAQARALGQAAGIAAPALAGGWPDAAPGFAFDQADPGAPAYFIFTSGSTGKPKAVACSHRPLRHFVAWHRATFAFTAADRFTLLSGLSHDPLLRDIFTPLSIGATLLIPRQATITEPGALRAWFDRTEATVTHLTPAMGQLLAAGGPCASVLPKLRHMFWGGDKLLPKLLAEVSRFAPAAHHTNFYGCSETPQAAAFYRDDGQAAWPTVPIGQGTDGFEVTLVDEKRRPVGPGETGEIAITSDYLSLGYVQEGQLAAPAKDGGAKTYYTGDRGRYLPDGNVLLLGRADDQIKIRGFRVELAEVTSALLACPGVRDAIALPLHRDTKPAIAAFIAVPTAPGEGEGGEAVRACLAAQLPGYMLPERIWVFETQLPLLPNGKVDRNALLAQAERDMADAPPADRPTRPMSDTEASLVASWAGMFGTKVTVDDSFVALGGDSLSYVEAYLATETVTGAVPQDWTAMSLAQLAASSVRQHRWFSSIDSFMLLRAVAITMIVAYHFDLSQLGNGFTGALFVVSGFLFGAMQMKDLFHQRSATRILASAKHILIPTAAFTALTCAVDLAKGQIPPLPMVLLSSDLLDRAHLMTRPLDGIFWYVDALLQMLLLLFVCVIVLPAKFRTPANVFPFCLGLFILGCAAKFGLPWLTDPDFLRHGTPDLSLAQVSPLGNFATFMLGALFATVPAAGTYGLLAAALAYAGIDAGLYGLINGISIAGGALLLTFWRRVTLPRPLASLVFTLSGASLFIYLSHMLFHSGTHLVWHDRFPALQAAIALLAGVTIRELWQASGRRLARRGWATAVRPVWSRWTWAGPRPRQATSLPDGIRPQSDPV